MWMQGGLRLMMRMQGHRERTTKPFRSAEIFLISFHFSESTFNRPALLLNFRCQPFELSLELCGFLCCLGSLVRDLRNSIVKSSHLFHHRLQRIKQTVPPGRFRCGISRSFKVLGLQFGHKPIHFLGRLVHLLTQPL